MGHSGTPAVSCSYKAASGFIYPLERGIMFVYKPPIFIKFDDVSSVNFARSGGTNRSFDIEVSTRGDTVYTFSSIEKDEYTRLYEFLKSKKLNVKSVGKMDPSKLDLSTDNIDHHAELVKADAASSSEDSNKSMSSDDEDFNPDRLEAKDAKEEYDSDPSDTDGDTDGGEEGSGSEAETKKAARKEKAAEKAERKKSSAPRKERGESGRKKKKTKLAGQPKRPMAAYFLWLNNEGREKIKEDNPGISVTDVSKKAGEIWGKMDSKAKEKFEKGAKEAKERYDEEYKEWFEAGGEAAIKQAKKDGGGGGSRSSPKKKKSSGGAIGGGGSGKGFVSKEYIDDSDSGDAKSAKDAKSGSGSGGGDSD